MCKGKSVSDNDVEALNEIISLKLNTSDNGEKYFSNDLNKIFNSLPEIIEEMKNFLLNNTNVPQGSSKNINFINSYEIIKSIRENREILNVQSISDENFNGIFKTEFSVFKHQNKFSKLKEYLIEEKHSLQSMLNKVRQIFKRFGFKDNFDKENIKNWITDFDNLIKVSKDNDLYYNNDQELDYIIDNNVHLNQYKDHSETFDKIDKIILANNLYEILKLDCNIFISFLTFYEKASKLIENLNEITQEDKDTDHELNTKIDLVKEFIIDLIKDENNSNV